MKIFISWSGERSLAIAKALRDWLPRVIQAVQPWLSETDIGKGTRWEHEIGAELAQTKFGIICLTPENLDARWVNFEAGALSKTIERSFVCTYLLELKATDVDGPLSQFNHTKIEREDSRKLLHTINRALENQALETEIINEAFDLWWPRFEERIARLPSPGERTPPRKLDEMVEEILALVRAQASKVDLRPDTNLRRYLTTYFGSPDQELQGFVDFTSGRLAQGRTLAEIEAEYVRKILAATNGNKTEAAQILGISRKNLYERIARSSDLVEQEMAEPKNSTFEEDKVEDNLAQ